MWKLWVKNSSRKHAYRPGDSSRAPEIWNWSLRCRPETRRRKRAVRRTLGVYMLCTAFLKVNRCCACYFRTIAPALVHPRGPKTSCRVLKADGIEINRFKGPWHVKSAVATFRIVWLQPRRDRVGGRRLLYRAPSQMPPSSAPRTARLSTSARSRTRTSSRSKASLSRSTPSPALHPRAQCTRRTCPSSWTPTASLRTCTQGSAWGIWRGKGSTQLGQILEHAQGHPMKS